MTSKRSRIENQPAAGAARIQGAVDELVTVRDWLRFAVSRFEAAGLVYGHGTASALDEAAFLVLATLRLPIDQLEPWLDARLTRPERALLADVIALRIETRVPAAYLVGAAYIQGHRFRVDERVIVPRSYLGELLANGGIQSVLTAPPSRVLDLCTGSGCLAILAALAFPEAHVDATDISADALAVARDNVADYRLDDRIKLMNGDLFQPVGGRRYDLILANPPYVAAAEVAAFDPEYAAEPVIAHAGGDDGLDLVRRILAAAPEHLEQGGVIVMEIGTGREIIEAEYPDLPFLWLDTETSEGEVLSLTAADFAGGQ
jgi:ribosomal protein L3 glutamine methyltransferase